eukprot:6214837-Pleurochrysis_carterae.AAC.3
MSAATDSRLVSSRRWGSYSADARAPIGAVCCVAQRRTAIHHFAVLKLALKQVRGDKVPSVHVHARAGGDRVQNAE